MPKDDDVGLLTGETHLEFARERMWRDDVLNEKFAPTERDGFREPVECGVIRITQHRCDRRDGLKLRDEMIRPDVAGMENVFDTAKDSRQPRIKKAVRVGKEANKH